MNGERPPSVGGLFHFASITVLLSAIEAANVPPEQPVVNDQASDTAIIAATSARKIRLPGVPMRHIATTRWWSVPLTKRRLAALVDHLLADLGDLGSDDTSRQFAAMRTLA